MSSSVSYTITESLAHGSRATLYRAIRSADGRSVVLKVLDPQRSRPKDLERLQNEFEIGRLLDSTAVVKPLALETYQGMPALVLEDFDGRSLGELLGGTPMPMDRFLPLAMAIARALSEIHRAGIVHKDVKPENILVNPATFELKLADFGLASRLPREQPPRLIEGSLPYLSPEQTGRMNRAIDNRSDLYALGVTFFQMLTGELPFEAKDPVEWVHCHVARAPPSPSALVLEVPEPIARIVSKLLAKMPEDRYQSAGGLVADLERCLTQWQACGRVEPFPLGQDDIWDRLQIPQQLYGRERKTAALLSAFDAVATTGAPALVMVSGYSGVGKSALVNALQKPIVEKRGRFIAGKFDQYKRDIPYATPAQAFQGLVRQILGESDTRIREWRDTLREALGPTGQLMVDLIPELELVIGPQPPVPELPPQQARNRFQLVFRQLIGVFAQAAHPLVLFLDDLQWLDAGTLALLADVVTHPDVHHLLLVGAYRDNEVDSSHPLMRSLQAIRKEGGIVHDVVLTPLSQNDVGRFVADALHDQPERVRPLSELVFEKTHGNPFFTIQFLTALAEEKLLGFDPGTRAFRWDLRRIHAKGYTDNVVDLLAGRIHRLTAACRKTLQVLACLGIRAETEVLMRALGDTEEPAMAGAPGGPDEGLHAPLREAERAGLLLRQGNSHAFVHDRIREAAYATMAPPERAGEHLRLGRLLLAGRTAEGVGDDVFELVNQFNRGLNLLADAGERDLVRRLNLRAASRSKAAIAYAAAREYLAQANALLPTDPWTEDYAEAFAIRLELAECAYLVGRFEEADARFREILEKARTDIDRARVLRLRIPLYESSGRYGDALEAGLAALRLLGFAIPDAEEDICEAVEAEQAEIPALLSGRRIADLALAPDVSDPRVRASLDLIADTGSPAYQVRPGLFPLLIFHGLTLSLRHGNTASACAIYSGYAILLVSLYRDVPSALAFSEMSLALNARFRDATRKASLLSIHGGTVHCWARPLAASKRILEQGVEAALQTGNHNYAFFCAMQAFWFDVESAESIGGAQQNSERYRALEDRIHSEINSLFFRMCEQFLLCLRGLTFGPPSFEDGTFQEEASLAAFRKADFKIGLYSYHVFKLVAAFTFGKFAEALAHADKAGELQGKQPLINILNVTHCFYHALTLTALHPQVPPERQAEFGQRLEGLLAQLKYWADNCPENFRNRHVLVLAEKCRIEGRDLEAMAFYEQAIRSAHDNGFVHHEALAYEQAGRFYAGRGLDTNGVTHLRNARACYARWGADGKVKQLDQQYPHLSDSRLSATTATVTMWAEQLDLYAVTKASQTISGEIVLDKLLRTLLTIVLEQGGAERACLVLRQGETFSVEAEATLDAKGVVTIDLEPAPLEGSPRIPTSVVRYAHRTKGRVILDEGDAGELAGDDYFAAHRPKSVLCMPIRRQAEVVGQLYLENDLLVGAFTPDRLAALELLATQAAISLENALLLAKEKAALAGAAFLAEAGAVLSESLDYEKTFARLGRLCVQELSDWCVIHIVEDKEIRRLAVAHRDPAKEPMLLEVQQRYPPRWDSSHPAIVALRTGEAVLTPEITDDFVRAVCHDEEHLRLVRALGARTGLSVPLVARGQKLGVLSLVSDAPGRRYGRADLDLAVELGRRAANAIDNARLYRASQEAVRARIEFLTIATHELNTPLTSLTLAVQSLRRAAPLGRVIDPQVLDRRLELLERQGTRLTRLIHDLLDVSHLDTGTLVLERADVDLGALVREVAERFEADLAGARCSVSIQTGAPVFGRWDRSCLDRVVTNLLSNAIKFGTGKPIEIAVGAERGMAQLAVRDHGIGIAPEQRDRIFGRFERAVSERHYGGLGLGLYISRRIVEDHGGSIRCESRPGAGATFIVELPCAEPA
ncbi:ATP-binding sensor histidine kinase [Sorangium sp. So ce295]|uniref:sensor histidine kinase n=1 Tax=Sorangium sp. So ce295 TaxID=3133295 RepID=UPI003F601003